MSFADAPTPPRPAATRLRLAALAFLAFTGCAAVQAARIVLARADRGVPLDGGAVLRAALVDWWAALVVFPALAWSVARWPVGPRGWAARGAALLAVAAACAAVQVAAAMPALARLLDVAPGAPASVAGVVSYTLPNVLALGILHAVVYYRRLRSQEVEASRLATALARAELGALRAQLQPHFLFNTLNAVAALIPRDPRAADRMVTRLSALLRAVLEHPPEHEHPLRAEVALLEQYLDVMRVRFGPRLVVEARIDPALGDALVPWLVLQPLAENALEHGVARATGPGRVVIGAERAGDVLRLAVDDSGAGDAPRRDGVGTGIGLANTRARLAQLHGDRARVTVGPSAEGGTRVVVELPYRARGRDAAGAPARVPA